MNGVAPPGPKATPPGPQGHAPEATGPPSPKATPPGPVPIGGAGSANSHWPPYRSPGSARPRPPRKRFRAPVPQSAAGTGPGQVWAGPVGRGKVGRNGDPGFAAGGHGRAAPVPSSVRHVSQGKAAGSRYCCVGCRVLGGVRGWGLVTRRGGGRAGGSRAEDGAGCPASRPAAGPRLPWRFPGERTRLCLPSHPHKRILRPRPAAPCR